ncbi:flagellar hook-basal body complex protein FliE [bacterium]|nr:flagellar hook-basal body complex protein FliE [bacterium]
MRIDADNLFREVEARLKPATSNSEIKGVLPSPSLSDAPSSVQQAAPSPTAGSGTQSFINSLSDALREVNRGQLQNVADVDSSVRGKGPELHKVMAETEEASLAFQMTIQFRNKALEAYQDVMRMQL